MNVYKGIAIYDPARQSSNINDLEMQDYLYVQICTACVIYVFNFVQHSDLGRTRTG